MLPAQLECRIPRLWPHLGGLQLPCTTEQVLSSHLGSAAFLTQATGADHWLYKKRWGSCASPPSQPPPSRAVLSSHMCLLECTWVKKYNSSVTLTTFQVLNIHTWLVVTCWIAQKESISISAQSLLNRVVPDVNGTEGGQKSSLVLGVSSTLSSVILNQFLTWFLTIHPLC